jgi:type IV pilus assembly protein PilE
MLNMHIDRLQAETAHQPAMKPLAYQKALSRHRKAAGFTLIEVMIAVVIIGIVAGIAVPSYSNYMTDARRTDAISFLSEVAGEQVRYFSDNNQYATTMKELGYGAAATFTTPEGHYMVSVNNATALKFLLTATPVTGGKQASDAECANFTISNTGQRKSTGTKTDCW